jgi:hypothetical protein
VQPSKLDRGWPTDPGSGIGNRYKTGTASFGGPVSCCGDVVQLVRTLPCHGRGRGFESRRPRHILKDLRMRREMIVDQTLTKSQFTAEIPERASFTAFLTSGKTPSGLM